MILIMIGELLIFICGIFLGFIYGAMYERHFAKLLRRVSAEPKTTEEK